MRWCMRNSEQALPSETECNRLSRILTVSPLLVSLLWKRGLCEAEEMDRYLSPGLRHLAPPSCIPGLEPAAEALAAALEAGKQIAVWGDYDVDGVTSTAMVKEFLQLRGHSALHHIPQRQDEGYGLSPQGLKELRDKGTQVLLTVDCGITDTDNIELARSYGIQVIVTDHHLPGETLPQAEAICNPRLSTCGDPGLADLAGVGGGIFSALPRQSPALRPTAGHAVLSGPGGSGHSGRRGAFVRTKPHPGQKRPAAHCRSPAPPASRLSRKPADSLSTPPLEPGR